MYASGMQHGIMEYKNHTNTFHSHVPFTHKSCHNIMARIKYNDFFPPPQNKKAPKILLPIGNPVERLCDIGVLLKMLHVCICSLAIITAYVWV